MCNIAFNRAIVEFRLGKVFTILILYNTYSIDTAYCYILNYRQDLFTIKIKIKLWKRMKTNEI